METYKKIYIKNYNKKNINRYTDVSKTDAFMTEVECYKRLFNYKNFPNLLSYDINNFSLTLEHCGTVLGSDVKRKKIKIPTIPNIDEQIYNIWLALSTERIIHLDIQLKNFTYKNDILYLIDFDIAVIDNKFHSEKIKEMYEEQKPNLTSYENFNKFINNLFKT